MKFNVVVRGPRKCGKSLALLVIKAELIAQKFKVWDAREHSLEVEATPETFEWFHMGDGDK